MQSIEVIRDALKMADGVFVALVSELRSHPLAQATPRGGNHAIWTIGHVAFVELGLPSILFGEPHPRPEWAPLFNMGTECSTDASKYPSFDEVLSVYQRTRAATLKLLDQLGDARLAEKPKNVPPGFEKEMVTIGHTFNLLALHQMMHTGQVADIRRALGLPRRA
ncbi:MAG: DinB family protein [Tepidisphaeraceae bacterium]